MLEFVDCTGGFGVRIRIGLIATFVLSATCSASGVAFAQERTQEETLVYTDPTMASPGHFVMGASGEFWGVYGSYPYATNVNGVVSARTASVTAYQYGGAVYAGYNDWLIQIEGLTGRLKTNRVCSSGNGPTCNVDVTTPTDQLDVSVRHTFSRTNWHGITPYLIAGVDFANFHYKDTITTPNVIWTSTQSPVLNIDNHYDTPYVGVGMLYEFNKRTGFRFDLAGGYSFGKYQFQTQPKVTDNHLGVVSRATLYYRILPELTAQVGLKAQAIPGGYTPGGAGAYMSLGYLHQF